MLQDLAASVDEEDVGKFTAVVAEFDSMTRLVCFSARFYVCLVYYVWYYVWFVIETSVFGLYIHQDFLKSKSQKGNVCVGKSHL